MTEKPNKPFIERLAKIYRETYVEPDWKKILKLKERDNNNNKKKEEEDA